MDPLEARIAIKQAAARDRAARLRALVPEAARVLRERGAMRVLLFGSLSHGLTVHEGSDVDLAVEGMTRAATDDAAWDLASLFICWRGCGGRRTRVRRCRGLDLDGYAVRGSDPCVFACDGVHTDARAFVVV